MYIYIYEYVHGLASYYYYHIKLSIIAFYHAFFVMFFSYMVSLLSFAAK